MGKLFFFVLAAAIAAALLFFPVYLETDAHYDMNRRKFGFAVYGYKILKLIGGYVATYNGGLALHVSEKKAILIPYTEINSERKRFSFVRTFRLKSIQLTTETGAEYLFPVAIGHTVFRGYFIAKGGKREKMKTNLWLTDGDILRVSFTCVIRFNLFIVLRNLFHFLKEKIKVLWQKKIKK